MEHAGFPLEFLILVGATTIVATFCHYLRLPTIVGFIVAGMVVGPFGTGLVGSTPASRQITELGVIFLMFTIGLEFSFAKLRQLRSSFLGLGLPQVIGTLVLAALIIKYSLNFPWSKSIFLGCLVSLSSTAIVMKLLQDARETAAPYGTTTIGILLCQDLAVIPMMLALPLLTEVQRVNVPFSWNVVGAWTFKLASVSTLLFLGGKYVVPFFLERVTKTKSRELFFFAMLLLCFGVAFAMEYTGFSLAFGAFIAGLMIAESPYGRQATADIVPLRDNFLGLFFASVGMMVDLKFMAMKFHWILLTMIALLILKSGLIFVIGRLMRFPVTTALITGLLIFQVGEFSFILADLGAKGGILDRNDLQFFLSVSVVSMMFTPFIFTHGPRLILSDKFDQLGKFSLRDVPKGIVRVISRNIQIEQSTLPPRLLSAKTTPGGAHTIIIGFGLAGQNLASAMRSLKIPYTIIEQNYAAVQKLQKQGESIFYGDASRPEILESVGIDTARLVVVCVSGVAMTKAIVGAVHSARPDVLVIIRVQYSRESDELGKIPNAVVVVAEHETTIELLGRSLVVYGVPRSDIENLITQTRESLQSTSAGWSDYLRNTVDFPAWEALGSVRPLRIKQEYLAVGKSLEDLQLRAQTGATVLAVYREGFGTAIPDGTFELQQGDILQLVGTPESLEKATVFLKTTGTTS